MPLLQNNTPHLYLRMGTHLIAHALWCLLDSSSKTQEKRLLGKLHPQVRCVQNPHVLLVVGLVRKAVSVSMASKWAFYWLQQVLDPDPQASWCGFLRKGRLRFMICGHFNKFSTRKLNSTPSLEEQQIEGHWLQAACSKTCGWGKDMGLWWAHEEGICGMCSCFGSSRGFGFASLGTPDLQGGQWTFPSVSLQLWDV